MTGMPKSIKTRIKKSSGKPRKSKSIKATKAQLKKRLGLLNSQCRIKANQSNRYKVSYVGEREVKKRLGNVVNATKKRNGIIPLT